jgi:hypothetical protein
MFEAAPFTSVMKQLRPLPRVHLLIHQICRFTVAGIWLYQGLFPKLLGPHHDELAMASAFGIRPELQSIVSYAAGTAEVAFALCLVLFHSYVWPQLASAIATAVLLLFVAIYAPSYLVAAFNPVVMNVASISLSAIAILVLRESVEVES